MARRAEPHEDADHLRTLFAASSNLVGVCLAGIGLVKVVVTHSGVMTACDDLLMADSMLFGVVSLLSFGVLRGRGLRRRVPVAVLDGLFFVALWLMVVVSGLLAWTVLR